MPVRTILLYPDPILLKPTLSIERIDDDVRQLVEDMVETLYAAPGVGLAANQVGASQRVCVIDLSAGEQPGMLKIFINPVIHGTEGRQVGEEGCLSFPDITLEIERPLVAWVDALDLNGQPFTLKGEGLMARALLHECEHLDGRVFLQNVSSLRREMVKKQIRKRIRAGDWVAAAAK